MKGPRDLVGRADQCAQLEHEFERLAAGQGRSLVLRGPAGIGKTALLEAMLRRRPPEVTVLRAAGVTTETSLVFAGLVDLLSPLGDHVDDLPAPQRDALTSALALGPARPGDRLAVCVATLSLLRSAAASRPLLVVVDDLPWLDPPSLECVRYAARRAGGSFAFAVAMRDDVIDASLADLREMPIPALAARESLEVLRGVAGDLATEVASTLVEVCEGNPLALVEFPATLNRGQRTGTEPLPSPLVPGVTLQEVMARPAASCPPGLADLCPGGGWKPGPDCQGVSRRRPRCRVPRWRGGIRTDPAR